MVSNQEFSEGGIFYLIIIIFFNEIKLKQLKFLLNAKKIKIPKKKK